MAKGIALQRYHDHDAHQIITGSKIYRMIGDMRGRSAGSLEISNLLSKSLDPKV